MKLETIHSLAAALIRGKIEANKFAESDDGGTSNFDTPALILGSEWSEEAIQRAFSLAGLRPYKITKRIYHVLDAVQGQGYRRTYMAQAFRDSLKTSGYNAVVDYRID